MPSANGPVNPSVRASAEAQDESQSETDIPATMKGLVSAAKKMCESSFGCNDASSGVLLQASTLCKIARERVIVGELQTAAIQPTGRGRSPAARNVCDRSVVVAARRRSRNHAAHEPVYRISPHPRREALDGCNLSLSKTSRNIYDVPVVLPVAPVGHGNAR